MRGTSSALARFRSKLIRHPAGTVIAARGCSISSASLTRTAIWSCVRSARSGDVYWALAYLPASAASGRRLLPAVVVVVGEGCRQVARLFGHEDVYSLTQVEMDDLVGAVVDGGAQDATIAHHDRPYGDGAPVRALDERFVAFTDMYRELVYKLPARITTASPKAGSAGAGRTDWRLLGKRDSRGPGCADGPLRQECRARSVVVLGAHRSTPSVARRCRRNGRPW